MLSPSAEVHRCVSMYRLAVPERVGRGRAGDRLGRGTGASLEFQDRRAYAVGDDIRHVDWRAVGRTDQLWVRVYREEIAPRVEVLLDASKSMATDDNKAKRAVDLAAVLLHLARAEGMQTQLILLGDRATPADFAAFQARGVDFASARPLAAGTQESLSWCRPGSLRYVISDFLSPHDAASLARPLAARAGFLALIQILSAYDAAPELGSALRLTDSETDETQDLVLDHATIAQYQEKLRRIGESLDMECRRASGVFVTLDAEQPLESLCQHKLLPARVLDVG